MPPRLSVQLQLVAPGMFSSGPGEGMKKRGNRGESMHDERSIRAAGRIHAQIIYHHTGPTQQCQTSCDAPADGWKQTTFCGDGRLCMLPVRTPARHRWPALGRGAHEA